MAVRKARRLQRCLASSAADADAMSFTTHSGDPRNIPVMRLRACAAAMAGLGIILTTPGPVLAAGERVHGCMSPANAREVLIAQKFVAPFRAVGEASRAAGGETVGLQLCLLGDMFVYDVTLLKRDGRVSHTLVDAHTGAVVAGPHGTK